MEQEELRGEVVVEATEEREGLDSSAIIRRENADNIVMNHLLASMGAGLIPMPMVDLVAMTGIQLNMLRKVADQYDIPFSKDRGKKVIAALMGAVMPLPVGRLVASAVKFVPIIGQATGALALPITAGASTYAIGKVFIRHFESGGNFLDFSPEKMKDFYQEMYRKGEAIVAKRKDRPEPEGAAGPQAGEEPDSGA